MRIPAKEECYRIICNMEMLDHIVAHSIQVCRVATFLVDNLAAQKVKLNRDLVHASALLHDITKTRSFKTKENHAETGAQLISSLGYPEVGSIIGQHVRLNEYFDLDFPREAEIVNYADKRVVHDKVVTLQERMNYIERRYAKAPEQREFIRWFWNSVKKLEDRIFIWLSFSPEELSRLLGPEDHSAELLEYRKVCSKLSLSLP